MMTVAFRVKKKKNSINLTHVHSVDGMEHVTSKDK